MLTAEENERLTRVGPGTPMGELMRRYWQPIAAMAELDENPVRPVKLLGESLVLYRDRKGGLGLIGDSCPHRRMSMLYGIPNERGIRCPYHGWLFSETGQCLEMPGEPADTTFPSRVQTTAYPVEESAGLVFAYLGPEPKPLLPRWDLFVWGNVLRDIGSVVIPCNWLQIMENSLDPVHVEWLHGEFSNYVLERLGRPDLQRVFYRSGQVSGNFAHEKIGFDEFQYGIIKRRVTAGRTEDDPDWRIGHPILFPNILRVGSSFQYRVPVDDTHTMHIWFTAYPQPPGEETPKQDTSPPLPSAPAGGRGRTRRVAAYGQQQRPGHYGVGHSRSYSRQVSREVGRVGQGHHPLPADAEGPTPHRGRRRAADERLSRRREQRSNRPAVGRAGRSLGLHQEGLVTLDPSGGQILSSVAGHGAALGG